MYGNVLLMEVEAGLKILVLALMYQHLVMATCGVLAAQISVHTTVRSLAAGHGLR